MWVSDDYVCTLKLLKQVQINEMLLQSADCSGVRFQASYGTILRNAAIYLRASVLEVVLHESTPPQIRQPAIYSNSYDAYVDGFVWALTFAERLLKHSLCHERGWCRSQDVRTGLPR